MPKRTQHSRRTRLVVWASAGVVIAAVGIGVFAPDPPSSTDAPAQPAPVRTVVKNVPGPTKTVHAVNPVNESCLVAGQLAVKVEKAAAEYSTQLAPMSEAINDATKANYKKDMAGINKASEKIDKILEATDGAAQDLAFARQELAKATAACKAAQ